MKTFSGVGDLIDLELAGRDPVTAVRLRARIMEDSLLHEAADLIGQAYAHGPSPASAAIIATVEDRIEALAARLAVGRRIVETAALDLGVAKPAVKVEKRTATPNKGA